MIYYVYSIYFEYPLYLHINVWAIENILMKYTF